MCSVLSNPVLDCGDELVVKTVESFVSGVLAEKTVTVACSARLDVTLGE